MGRYSIALGKPPPPPPEPAYYFIGISIGEVRKEISVIVGHLDINYFFIVDHAEAITAFNQVFAKQVRLKVPILDFAQFFHKPMTARFDNENKAVIMALLLQKIPYDHVFADYSEWRTLMYERCTYLNIRIKSITHRRYSYGSTESKYQRPFELALSIAVDHVEAEKRKDGSL